MTNSDMIHRFYTAFSEGDAETMASCYHENIQFQDPVFGKISGTDPSNMWRMLIERANGNMDIKFTEVTADEEGGSAQWIARYPYGKKKRPVINFISASFKFKDGKIIEHTDHFDLWKWSRQALGLPGTLLGWTPFIQNKIKSTVSLAFSNWKAENNKS